MLSRWARMGFGFALLLNGLLGQGLPQNDALERDIRSQLNAKREWDAVTLYGKWELEHDKVLRTAPPDAAKHPFTCRTRTAPDGTHSEFKGLAIYMRIGPDRWGFDRLFFFEDATRLVGAPVPSAADRRDIVLRALSDGERARSFAPLRPEDVTWV